MMTDDYYEGYETVQNKVNPDGVFRYMLETRHCPLRDWDIEYIAKAFGLGVGTMRVFIRRNGLDARLEDEIMGKVNYCEVEDLYNQGNNDTEICKALKISAPSVALWRKKNNLAPNGLSFMARKKPVEQLVVKQDFEEAAAKIDLVALARKPMTISEMDAAIAEIGPNAKRVAATIKKDLDDAINDMIEANPPVESQPTTSGEAAEFEEMPDRCVPIENYKPTPKVHQRSKASSIKVDIEVDTAELNKAIEAIKSETAKSGLTADFNRLEKQITFLRGVAVGAGVKNIDELLDQV